METASLRHLAGNWRDEVRRKMLEAMESAGLDTQSIEREKNGSS